MFLFKKQETVVNHTRSELLQWPMHEFTPLSFCTSAPLSVDVRRERHEQQRRFARGGGDLVQVATGEQNAALQSLAVRGGMADRDDKWTV